MVFSGIILLPLAVIALVFLAIALAKSGEEEGEVVIKKVYLYLVLFTTLMMVIGGSVAAFMAVADIVSPTPHYQSYEEFKRYNALAKDSEREEIVLSEEELQSRYNEMITTEHFRQTARAKNSLFKSLGWIIIPLPIFFYSRRRVWPPAKD